MFVENAISMFHSSFSMSHLHRVASRVGVFSVTSTVLPEPGVRECPTTLNCEGHSTYDPHFAIRWLGEVYLDTEFEEPPETKTGLLHITRH